MRLGTDAEPGWVKSRSQLRVADVDSRAAPLRDPTLTRRELATSPPSAPGAAREMRLCYICKMLQNATLSGVLGNFEKRAFDANYEFTETYGVLNACVHFSRIDAIL